MKLHDILRLRLIISLIFIAAVSGCGDDHSTLSEPESAEGAQVRIIHASPDAPAVDIYNEGDSIPLICDLGYGEVSDFLELDTGIYNFQIREAGADFMSQPDYETGEFGIRDNVRITALAAGLLSSMEDSDKFRVLPLIESFDDPGAGNAAVRFIHGSADAPSVSLDIGNDGSAEITGFATFDDSGASGIAVSAGSELDIGVLSGTRLSCLPLLPYPRWQRMTRPSS